MGNKQSFEFAPHAWVFSSPDFIREEIQVRAFIDVLERFAFCLFLAFLLFA